MVEIETLKILGITAEEGNEEVLEDDDAEDTDEEDEDEAL
jgi:hypothetical protein